MSCSDEDDFKSCHIQDRGYWAAHGNTDLQLLPSSHSALERETHAQVAEKLGYDGNYIRWNMEEFQRKLDQLMWYWAISVRQVKPQNMKFTLLSFGTLYLLPYHGCVFNASWKTWEPSLLTTCVNVVVSAEEACHPSCQNWEKQFPFHVQQGNAPELINGRGIPLLRNEDYNCFLPLNLNKLILPHNPHELPQDLCHLWTILVHLVWKPIWTWCWGWSGLFEDHSNLTQPGWGGVERGPWGIWLWHITWWVERCIFGCIRILALDIMLHNDPL